MDSLLLELVGVDKLFYGNQVLFGVDFTLQRGEIVSLVGTNGAGKSTLCDVIAGRFRPEAGNIMVNGREVILRNPRDAEAAGIGMVHQEPALCENMSVYENIFLNKEILRSGVVLSRKQMMAESAKVLSRLGYEIDVRALVQDLPLVSKGVVAIAKAMIMNPSVLIFDEVTATLNAAEVEHLFAVMREIRNNGIGIINIGHDIREIVRISDRVVVLKDGRRVAELASVDSINEKQIIGLMLGDTGELERLQEEREVKHASDEVLIKVDGMSRSDTYQDVTFDLHRGEILGLAGLKGSGITEVLFSIFGALKYDAGTVVKDGELLNVSGPREAVAAGIGMITNDRQKEGLALVLPVDDNIAIVTLKRLGGALSIVRKKAIVDMAVRYIQALSIKTTGPTQLVQYLSGGNQQKVVVAKWLLRDPDVFLVDEPTRGVDVKAKNDIYDLLMEQRQLGKGVLVYSPEVRELLTLCDRVLVMSHGFIVDEIGGGDERFTEKGLLEALHSSTSAIQGS